jgi:hypothetical protein
MPIVREANIEVSYRDVNPRAGTPDNHLADHGDELILCR